MKNKVTLTKILTVLASFFVLCGFADCSFSASNATYQVDRCSDPQNWKVAISTDKTEVVKSEYKKELASNETDCKKLIRYHVKTKIDEAKNLWGEYDLYVGIKKQGSSCQLVVSTPWVGPPPSSGQESLNHWDSMNQPILKQITDANPHSGTLDIIRTKEAYIKWCEGL